MRPVLLNREDCPQCAVSEAAVARAIAVLDECPEYCVPPGELSVVLLDDAEHCALHSRYLNDPSPTDVITFPGDAAEDFAGEIILNVDQAIREGPLHGNDAASELTLYLVHGWLHLAGLDDHDAAGCRQMREAERHLLSRLQQHRAMPPFRIGAG